MESSSSTAKQKGKRTTTKYVRHDSRVIGTYVSDIFAAIANMYFQFPADSLSIRQKLAASFASEDDLLVVWRQTRRSILEGQKVDPNVAFGIMIVLYQRRLMYTSAWISDGPASGGSGMSHAMSSG